MMQWTQWNWWWRSSYNFFLPCNLLCNWRRPKAEDADDDDDDDDDLNDDDDEYDDENRGAQYFPSLQSSL